MPHRQCRDTFVVHCTTADRGRGCPDPPGFGRDALLTDAVHRHWNTVPVVARAAEDAFGPSWVPFGAMPRRAVAKAGRKTAFRATGLAPIGPQ